MLRHLHRRCSTAAVQEPEGTPLQHAPCPAPLAPEAPACALVAAEESRGVPSSPTRVDGWTHRSGSSRIPAVHRT